MDEIGKKIECSPLNLNGRAISLFGRWFGSARFQDLYSKVQLLFLAGMNFGGATLGYEENGESFVMKLVSRHYRSDESLTIFDVGAHEGHYAQLLLQKFGSNVSIYSFEPSSELYARLNANLTARQFCVRNLALGEIKQKVHLFGSYDRIPTLVPNAFDVTGQERVTDEIIECVRLDEFCQSQGIEKIHFLKIDVEGYEMNVLKGAGELIPNKIDFIQFEMGPHCIASRTYMFDFFNFLHHAYRIYRILRAGLCELHAYSPRLEQFASATNYLAINRGISSEW